MKNNFDLEQAYTMVYKHLECRDDFIGPFFKLEMSQKLSKFLLSNYDSSDDCFIDVTKLNSRRDLEELLCILNSQICDDEDEESLLIMKLVSLLPSTRDEWIEKCVEMLMMGNIRVGLCLLEMAIFLSRDVEFCTQMLLSRVEDDLIVRANVFFHLASSIANMKGELALCLLEIGREKQRNLSLEASYVFYKAAEIVHSSNADEFMNVSLVFF